MSVLFNHARRYDLYGRNPIQWVRQSAKRRSAPDVLTCNEIRQLLAALEPRERIMVLLDVATGLRQRELFALKWKDVGFKNKQLWVSRSIVQQVVGRCKTEASQKPVPLHDYLIRGFTELAVAGTTGLEPAASAVTAGRSPAGPRSIRRLGVRLSATFGFIGQRRRVLVQRFVQPLSPRRARAKT